MRTPISWLAGAALAVAAWGAPAIAQQTAPAVPRPALDRANLDTTCAACTDFYQFATGGWRAANAIPAAYSSWGSFNELFDRNNDVLHAVLEDAVKTGPARGGTTAKLGTFYATCMDSARAEAEGARPLDAELRRIAALRSTADLPAEIARLQLSGVDVLFRFTSTPDPKNVTQVIADASQGGLGLPDRDYYTKTDSATLALRAEYQAHVGRVFRMLGSSAERAAAEARQVMDVETALARASMTRTEQRDPNAVYHKMPVAQLRALAPSFDWSAYLRAMGVPGVAQLNVEQPGFFRAVDTLGASTSLDAWKTYLRWHLASQAAPYLDSAWVNENFRFASKLTGAKELQPRWKRCLYAADAGLGEALGQAYTAAAFTPQAKARALAMVRNLTAVMRSRIAALDWMSDATRKQALVKLDAFQDKIGYPDRWRDYSTLLVRPGAFVENVRRASEFELRRNLSKIGEPVDRTEWGMTPPTVNAYYNPLWNEIVFPAGILQPPFFDPNADDAVNYGAMGAVIGHEITHGFDDQGRQYDAQGKLRDWWSKEDQQKFTARAARVVSQFDAFTVLDSLHVNGRLTLGENIADLGGLTIAYQALQKSMEGKPRPARIDGFTPEQRFFLSWAQVWRENTRPEYERMLVSINEHAPARFRVNGPLANMPEFATAWGCKSTDPMVRSDSVRASIW